MLRNCLLASAIDALLGVMVAVVAMVVIAGAMLLPDGPERMRCDLQFPSRVERDSSVNAALRIGADQRAGSCGDVREGCWQGVARGCAGSERVPLTVAGVVCCFRAIPFFVFLFS